MLHCLTKLCTHAPACLATLQDGLGDKLTNTHSVCVRKLTGRGLHTWNGIIGYIHKDAHLPHFK